MLWLPSALLISIVGSDNSAGPVGPPIAQKYHRLFSMFLRAFVWNIGLASGGIARVGQIQLLQPFITLAMAVALLGETVTMDKPMSTFGMASKVDQTPVQVGNADKPVIHPIHDFEAAECRELKTGGHLPMQTNLSSEVNFGDRRATGYS